MLETGMPLLIVGVAGTSMIIGYCMGYLVRGEPEVLNPSPSIINTESAQTNIAPEVIIPMEEVKIEE
jgi:hypothetical protein